MDNAIAPSDRRPKPARRQREPVLKGLHASGKNRITAQGSPWLALARRYSGKDRDAPSAHRTHGKYRAELAIRENCGRRHEKRFPRCAALAADSTSVPAATNARLTRPAEIDSRVLELPIPPISLAAAAPVGRAAICLPCVLQKHPAQVPLPAVSVPAEWDVRIEKWNRRAHSDGASLPPNKNPGPRILPPRTRKTATCVASDRSARFDNFSVFADAGAPCIPCCAAG